MPGTESTQVAPVVGCRGTNGPLAGVCPVKQQVNRSARLQTPKRRGATVVEMAVVLPVFLVFLWGLFEFGHAYTVSNTLNAACIKAARMGVAEDVSTTQVKNKVKEILGTAVNLSHATITVKNAGVFDTAGTNAATVNYSQLANIELSTAESGQLFLVRVEIPYSDVSLLTPKWLTNLTLKGHAVMRHE